MMKNSPLHNIIYNFQYVIKSLQKISQINKSFDNFCIVQIL